MKIVFLDGFTINPGDITWDKLNSCGDLTVYDRTSPEDVLSRSLGADVLIVNKTALDASHFAQLPNLKLVCVAATGYDKIDVLAARQHGVTVCNCAGYSSVSVAQMIVSLILEVADSVGSYTIRNHEGDWCRSQDFCYTFKPRMELYGKRMAIVGFGNIGSTVARIMQALGVNVLAVTSKSADELPQGIHKIGLEEAFATCDIISLNCPLNASNQGFVNASLLQRAKHGLILVNTARGGLISEDDVAEALRSGRLGAYCTDVLTCEPASCHSPIINAPHTFITPHIAWNTPEARLRIIDILVDNINAYVSGHPTSVVN